MVLAERTGQLFVAHLRFLVGLALGLGLLDLSIRLYVIHARPVIGCNLQKLIKLTGVLVLRFRPNS